MKKLVLSLVFIFAAFTSFANQSLVIDNDKLDFECDIVVTTYDGNGFVVNRTHYHTTGSCDSLLKQIR